MHTTHCLIIGAQKAGTTSLFDALALHPDICGASNKEPHYFDLTPLDRVSAAHFEDTAFAHRSGQRVLLDATPAYFQLPYVASAIRTAVPDARLIVLLRDPVERAHSAWWMFASRGHERRSFEAAVTDELSRGPTFEDLTDEAYCRRMWMDHIAARRRGEVQHPLYLSSSLYVKHLAAYYSSFASEQILVLFQKDLKYHGDRILDKIGRFLSVDRGGFGHTVPRSNSVPGRRVAAMRATAHRTPVVDRLRTLVPATVRAAITSQVARGDEMPPIPASVVPSLRSFFGGPDRALAELLEAELPW